MKKNIEFDYICADCSGKQNHMFRMDDDYDDYDCHDTCVVWNRMTFYGVPFDISDEHMNRIHEGDYTDAVKIGELMGCLIFCKQILAEGEDPLEICDDVDVDLEYTISALSDEGGPLNMESGDPEQDVYYIHELKMEPGYDDALLKSKIINELPGLILTFFHVNPDLLAFYPAPLEYAPDPNVEVRYQVLQNIAAQKVDSAIGAIIGDPSKKLEPNNIVKFGDAYQFTKDELNLVMRRRHSGSSYPAEAKDREEYAFYEANGFEEVGNSRLLYKYVGRG